MRKPSRASVRTRPPTTSSASRTTTSTPFAVRWRAAHSPASPAPTTTASARVGRSATGPPRSRVVRARQAGYRVPVSAGLWIRLSAAAGEGGTVIQVTRSVPPTRGDGDQPEPRPLGCAPLADGQTVTVLVGLGLEMSGRHRVGSVAGPLHPRAVAVGQDGRPRLRPAAAPPTWTQADDVAALLRLGWGLAAPESRVGSVVRELALDEERRLDVVLGRLMAATGAETLGDPSRGGSARTARAARSRASRGRHAARRRWWGRRR